MESYSTRAVLSAVDQGFTSKMKEAADSLDRIDSGSRKATGSILDIAKGIGVFKALSIAGNTLVNSLGGAVERFDTMNQFPKVMQQIGFSAEESEASISRLSDGIQGVPTSLDEITASTQKLAMLTGDLDKATDASIALNNAFYASGASSSDASRGLVQYTQMLSKGTVDIMSWRTLQETMGIALKDLAESFGYAGSAATTDLYAAIQSGQITFDQLNDKLIELNGGVDGFAERAAAASAGIGTSFTNMEIAVTRGMENLIRSTNDALVNNGLPGFQEMIESTTSGINKGFSAVSKGAEVLVNNLDVLVPVLGTATAGFAAYKAAMNITDKYTAMKKAAAGAAETLTAVKNANSLATKAALVNQKATEAAATAELFSTKAHKYETASLKAQAKAKELSIAATKARTLADKAGAGAAELHAAAEKAEALASEAQARADKKAALASKAKSVAETKETAATSLNTAAEGANAIAETAGAKAAAVSSIAIAAKTALLGVLSGELGIVAAAQMVWNAAMNANPIGVAVVTTAALATALVGVSKALGKLDTEAVEAEKRREEAIDSSKDLIESMESAEKAYDENASSIKAAASANDELAGKIGRLMEKESKSVEEKAEMQSYVEALNSSMEGLNLQYDAENDSLSMSIDQIKSKIAAYKAQAEAQAAQERLTEILKEQYEADEKLVAIEKERTNIEKEYQNAVLEGPKAVGTYNKAVNELKEQEEELNEKKKELAESEEYLTGVMVESQTAQAEAVNAGTESQIISMEDLNETQQSVVESMSSTWQSYADQATNMFDTLSDKSELSVSEMTSNLQENQRIIGEWANNIEALAQRGVNEGLLEQLRQAGPESAGYVNAMVQASDAELQALSDAFSQGGETATTAFKTAFQLSDVPQGVMDMVTQTEQSLRAQIETVDWASLGETGIDGGVKTGIEEGSGEVSDAAVKMASDSREAAGASQGEGSPCALWIELGSNMVAGLAKGLMDSGTVTEAAVRMADNAVEAVQKSMRGMEKINTSAFSGISTAAKTGMSQMTEAVTSGTAKSNAAMQSGMRAMNVSEQAGLRTMRASMASGMTAVRQAVDSGMNQSNASVVRGGAAMTASLRSLRSSFYNSGYYASAGLAQGINAGAGAAISAAQRLADRVASAMREALQVHSPSKVTMQIGEYAGIGVAAGLMNTISDIEKASLKVSKAMVPGTVADYADSISAYRKTDNYIYQAGSRESETGYAYLIEGLKEAIADLNIQVQAVISAKDIGDTSAKYVDRKIGSRTVMKERYGSV